MLIFLAVCMFTGAWSAVQAVTLVQDGRPRATIITPTAPKPHTAVAADLLAEYVQRISGAELTITDDPQAVTTPVRIWVGHRPELDERFPDQDFSLSHAEEHIVRLIGHDLILFGSDRMIGHEQVEAGTELAVLAFLENELGVRWLWPGDLGTVVPAQATIELAQVDFRYYPQLRYREPRAVSFERTWRAVADKPPHLPGISDPAAWVRQQDRVVRQWLNRNRAEHAPSGESPSPLRGSLYFHAGHAFQRWHTRFANEHPQWFALHPDGTRVSQQADPFPSARDVKLCISNPEVARQWLADAAATIDSNARRNVISASPNDMGWQGYCVCDNCKAWDDPNGPMLEQPMLWRDLRQEHYSLTDRYARFWNMLAKGLRERYPDRDIHVGTIAYHVYRPAPVQVRLEPNITVAYVGVRRRDPIRNSAELMAQQRELWRQWAEQTHGMVWRPNLMIDRFNMSLPYVFMRRHAENVRYLADHKLIGLNVDSFSNHWATQGVQYYVTTRLAWNPYQDIETLLADYYEKGFGPAAPYIASYFELFEQLYYRLADDFDTWHRYMDLPTLYRGLHAMPPGQRDLRKLSAGAVLEPRLEQQAQRYLDLAARAVADADEIYQQRVAFVQIGLDFTRAQLDTMQAMNDVRSSQGDQRGAAMAIAQQAASRRQQILEQNLDNFALNYLRMVTHFRSQQDYLGPLVEQAD